MYVRGDKAVSTKTVHSDDTIDYAYQKTGVLDTTITQDATGPDLVYEFLGYNLGEESARRIGISNLLYGWQQQYQGQMICMGCPGVKAHDYVMIYDTFAQLYGVAVVREVTHSFNINTGFTTSITPGVIGFSTDEESGMIQSAQNLLATLNCFSQYIETRRQLRDTYEQDATAYAEYEIIREKLERRVARSEKLYRDMDIAAFTNKGVLAGIGIYRHFKYGKVTMQIKNAVTTFKTAYKAAKIGATGIKGTMAAIKAGSIAVAGAPTFGVGSVVMAVVWIAVDILVQDIFEWLTNRNVCTLMPLWWNGYPFISGVNGGENILLVRGQGTDENTGGEAPNFND
jgi:hypothetical protein